MTDDGRRAGPTCLAGDGDAPSAATEDLLGLAHELNDLMTVVLSVVERASAEKVSRPVRDYLAHAGQAARRAGEIARRIASLAPPGPPRAPDV